MKTLTRSQYNEAISYGYSFCPQCVRVVNDSETLLEADIDGEGYYCPRCGKCLAVGVRAALENGWIAIVDEDINVSRGMPGGRS